MFLCRSTLKITFKKNQSLEVGVWNFDSIDVPLNFERHGNFLHVNGLLENKIAPKSTASIRRNSFLTQLSAQAGRINRQSLAPQDASLHSPTLQAPALRGMDSLSNYAVNVLSINAIQEESEYQWNNAILGIFCLQQWSKNNTLSLVYILHVFQDSGIDCYL